MYMIVSFGDAATEDLWQDLDNARTRRFPADVRPVARRKLDMIHAAATLKDLTVPPGNQLEALKGDWKGWHSIRVNKQWRVVFRWSDGGAQDVKVIDYH